jgi:hypothetical protein
LAVLRFNLTRKSTFVSILLKTSRTGKAETSMVCYLMIVTPREY